LCVLARDWRIYRAGRIASGDIFIYDFPDSARRTPPLWREREREREKFIPRVGKAPCPTKRSGTDQTKAYDVCAKREEIREEAALDLILFRFQSADRSRLPGSACNVLPPPTPYPSPGNRIPTCTIEREPQHQNKTTTNSTSITLTCLLRLLSRGPFISIVTNVVSRSSPQSGTGYLYRHGKARRHWSYKMIHVKPPARSSGNIRDKIRRGDIRTRSPFNLLFYLHRDISSRHFFRACWNQFFMDVVPREEDVRTIFDQYRRIGETKIADRESSFLPLPLFLSLSLSLSTLSLSFLRKAR